MQTLLTRLNITKKVLFTFIGVSLSTAVFANNIEDKTVMVNHTPVHYYKVGQGSPIVLLPGYGVTNNFWSKSFITCLSQQHSVYLIDYPDLTAKTATVPAMADEVNDIIQELKLDHPKIVGSSLGGAIALELAYDHPHSNSGLTLIAPVVPNSHVITGLNEDHPQFTSQDATLNDLFKNNLYHYDKSTFNYYKAETLFPNKQLRADSGQARLQMNAIEKWSNCSHSQSKVIHIPIKTNIFIAAKDTLLDPQTQINAFKYYNNKSMTLIENTGHAAFYDDTNNICKAIVS